ncbi:MULTISPECIES: Eco57I restriction-modification methylase domain-containing protein [Frankia]|uniref:site-specific DNA-methyltransferase (adenine-specific) n=1 Tax=Frankia alni (strain DSM 45986 / CECT 9034 / ACN14a) TaxID=326424 RepID=Q0RC73_FRAAA|nr:MULTISPECIES: class I SAM-dependent DNA methyltransferase [Frankia]CAJ64954.1 putative Type II restriction enzyme, methylase subunit [Frankia alni ACN14a]
MFDSIHNVGEFLSDHWLASVFPGQLRTLTKEWSERDAHGKPSPLRGLVAASGPFAKAKGRLPEPRQDAEARVSRARAVAGAAELVEAAGALHDLLLTAAGFDVKRQELTTEHGGLELAVPLTVRAQSHSGEALHILEALPAAGEDDLFDRDGAGRLLRPLRVIRSAENVQEIAAVTEALSTLFLSASPPRYAMVVAGGWLLLTDAARWSEGRYLVFDADTALARRQDTASGELAWHAGLWSADVLLPAGDEPASRLDGYLDESVKHAVGVSKDLREGLRESVEILANEVVAQRRAQGLPVEDLPELPRELVAQSLRFLYRILFLLYAEARPELGVLPVGAPEYGAGYGLDRLRDLLQVKLTSPAMRDGRHLHESLKLLFGLVNNGHRYRNGAGDDRADDGLRFEPLKSDLFDPGHAPLVDTLPLRNEALQQILALLLLSKERKGRDRGFVSYAQLGINQLGAVYEGLMSYSGFFAERDMIELAKDGEPDKGSWFVPAERAGEYDEKHLVMRVDPVTGHRRKITHRKGSFVFRLSGRDRQRSASYYTPEVLTRCVVKHSLAELLPDDEEWKAQRILDLTICEPALGSGAFLNEAINQLARKYLERRQEELKTSIPPDQYADELQKVKAHLALHRCYGVDLNRTAVELAEVSLWLNVMHPGLQGPWFGLHLRRGNSLVGARRATYDFTALNKAKQSWLKTPPTERHLAEGDIEFGEIHHFLLPAHGWGAVAETKQAKELAKDAADALKLWSKEIKKKPAIGQLGRLRALARRVERLWELTIRRLEISEREVARHIDVWQAERLPETAGAVSRQEVESALNDPERPYRRLRLVMDAWCALWFWPLNSDAPPPSLDEWIATLEDLLGTEPKAARKAQGDRLGLFGEIESFADLQDADDNERIMHQMKPVLQTMLARPWLGIVREIADREGFFHWELDYAHIFKQGGFDLQVGNPPWVRPTWEDDTALAEFDPFFKLEDRIPDAVFRDHRKVALASQRRTARYLNDVTSWVGLTEHVGSTVDHPVLAGLKINLYTNFVERVWRSSSAIGISGLLHPEGHYSDPRAGTLRMEAYRRLRLHAQFGNNLLLFAEVDNKESFGVNIYGQPRVVEFRNIARIVRPEILDESLVHDGFGEIPGIQFPQGGWDLRPHSSRIVRVDEKTLQIWGRLFDPPGSPWTEARLMRPLVAEHQEILEAISRQRVRLADIGFNWSLCWDEGQAKKDGYIVWDTHLPGSWDGVILQGPHFTSATPLARQPNLNCRSNKDYSPFDFEALDREVLPRTNYRRACDIATFRQAISLWDGRPFTDVWRLAWRNMVSADNERSLHAAIIPPGPTHVHAVHSLALESKHNTVINAGLWSSLPYDYLVKVSGMSKVAKETVDRFPLPIGHPARPWLASRALRLNCLTADYAPLWEELYETGFAEDGWTPPFTDRPALGVAEREWTMATPLRFDFDRRAALVEIDALAALMLGLTAEQLCLMYRAQFAVLRKYEYAMYFDAQGRKIAKDHHAMGVKQQKDDYKILHAWVADRGLDCDAPPELADRYRGPFRKPDREAEMRAAYAEFARRLGLDPETGAELAEPPGGVKLAGTPSGAVERAGA